jgi:hypothetical protein
MTPAVTPGNASAPTTQAAIWAPIHDDRRSCRIESYGVVLAARSGGASLQLCPASGCAEPPDRGHRRNRQGRTWLVCCRCSCSVMASTAWRISLGGNAKRVARGLLTKPGTAAIGHSTRG